MVKSTKSAVSQKQKLYFDLLIIKCTKSLCQKAFPPATSPKIFWAVELLRDLVFVFGQICQAVRSSCSQNKKKTQLEKKKEKQRERIKQLGASREVENKPISQVMTPSGQQGRVNIPEQKNKSKSNKKISLNDDDTKKTPKKNIIKAEKTPGLYKVTKVNATGLYGEQLLPEIILKSPVKR